MKRFFLPLLAAAFWFSPASVQAQAFPDGPGKEILEKECSTCHAPDMVRSFGRSREEWEEVVTNMIDQGAKLSEEQIPVLVDYLVKNWGLESEKPKQAGPPAAAATPTPVISALLKALLGHNINVVAMHH